ncbi:MAG: hypothetical protein A4E65_01490 [Syntrophorhabdus sp. PtaU1.Bin153]|nr:MAG: hypothetical protein A4E65_01490 [Syntrophorhabdus sp. PtaU1.Bin153]
MGKVTQNRFAVQVTANAFVISSVIILMPYSLFTKPIRLGLAGTFVIWELNPLTIFVAIVMGSLALPFLVAWARGKDQDDYHAVLPISLLLLHTSIGAASLLAVLIPVVFFVRLCLFLIFFSVPRVFGVENLLSAPLGVSHLRVRDLF